MNASIFLGTGGDDGDLSVESADGTTTVSLDGDTGDVTNSLPGNGLARINANGTIFACWRCDTDPLETRRACATSAPIGQIGSFEERRISGSS